MTARTCDKCGKEFNCGQGVNCPECNPLIQCDYCGKFIPKINDDEFYRENGAFCSENCKGEFYETGEY